jgi:D-lactate dehydrogenase (cytochrome)
MPFAPLVNILGPAGERWVPLHGLLPQSQVLAFHREALSLLETHRPAMQAHGVHHGTMFTCAGPGAFLYEFALYWQDERTLFHDTLLGPHHVAGLTDYPANPEGKRLVEMLHRDLIALFHRYGAVHFQVGKIYPLLKDRDPAAVGLLRALKQALDPQGLMNPTVLGL